jgi:hypothetical protein
MGCLPLGRFRCTFAEVEAAFVSHPRALGSTTRASILADLKTLVDLLGALDPKLVVSLWLGGSFVTDKFDPDDGDVVVLVDAERVAALTTPDRAKFDRLFLRLETGQSMLRFLTGMLVDPYALEVSTVVDPLRRTTADREYYEARGHWDDFWLRLRTSPKGSPPTAAEAKPRRGYLEVAP